MAGDGVASRFNNVAYGAADERMVQSMLLMAAAATRARPGVMAAGGLTVTVGSGPEAAVVATGGGVINDTGAGAGSYLFVLPATVSKPLAARPSAGQTRLDEVVGIIKNYDERPADGLNVRELDIAVITGTPTSGTPTAPTIPAGQLRISELLVPASGSVTVQKPLQRTVARGGVLPLASQAEQDAIEVVYDGLVVYREDTDVFQGRANGAWERFALAGRGGVPFAQAAGKVNISGSSLGPGDTATVNISFPASRFNVAPIVGFDIAGFVAGASLVVTRQADSITTSGARLVVVNVGAGVTSFSTLPLQWSARQMTPTTADG